MDKQQTKIVLVNEYGEYSISVNKADMNVEDIIHDLVIPVLKSCGFADESIKGYFDG